MIQQPVQHDFSTVFNQARTNGLTAALMIYWDADTAYANTSHMSIALWAHTELSTQTSGRSWTGYITIGDQTKTLNGYDEEKPVGSDFVHMMSFDNVEVQHNIDGTASVDIAASLTGPTGTSLQGVTCGGNFALSIDPIERKSTIIPGATVNIDQNFLVPFYQYDSRFTDTLVIKDGESIIAIMQNVKPSEKVRLSDFEIFELYNRAGDDPLSLTLSLTTRYNDELIGMDEGMVTARLTGTSRVRVNGVWKNAIPFVRSNGVWKHAIAYTRSNGEWKNNR